MYRIFCIRCMVYFVFLNILSQKQNSAREILSLFGEIWKEMRGEDQKFGVGWLEREREGIV